MKFREHHLQQILNDFKAQHLPLDVFLNRYFRAHGALGSKDRKCLSETVYETIRWESLFNYLKYPVNPNPYDFLQREEIPAHIRVSFPETLYHELVSAYGEERAWKICLASNSKAPTTIRINPLKTTREALLLKWRGVYETRPCTDSPWGIVFAQRVNFYELAEFKEGLFEVQDEASQLISQLVAAKPKQWVLDYCAGAGGKTLAFAPLLENTGQIYLHDIRASALQEARKRLNRAGIQNVQFGIHPRLKKKMDWVLVDAPCSGTGTLRRNPDIKWKFDLTRLSNTLQEQRKIFAEAYTYLKSGGSIVYATCSILPQENQQQAAYFSQTHGLQITKEFQNFPEDGGGDGFYGAVLKTSIC